jgi:hypothetical protein
MKHFCEQDTNDPDYEHMLTFPMSYWLANACFQQRIIDDKRKTMSSAFFVVNDIEIKLYKSHLFYIYFHFCRRISPFSQIVIRGYICLLVYKYIDKEST